MVAPFHMNEKATIQRRPAGKDAYGRKISNDEPWEDVAVNVWCSVQDVLPSRAERSENGARIGTKQARLRLRKQIPIAADMRVVLNTRGGKVMQVISGPALLDDRAFVECMLEEVGGG